MNSLSARRRHPLATLLVLLLALVVTGGLYAAFAPTHEANASGAAGDRSVEKGRQLFLANCSTCHGMNAEGTSDGPNLIGVGAASFDFQLATGRMPLDRPKAQAGRKQVVFTDDEIAALAAYGASLGPGPAIPTEEMLDTSNADPARGGEIFRTNCAMCHNFAGAGGALTSGKYAPTVRGVEPRHLYQAMVTGPQSMPVFSDAQLPVEDKQDVIAFIQALDEERSTGASLGQLGPVTEGVFAWIFGIGILIGCAVWLGAKSS